MLKVAAFGTFDLFHLGHQHFLKEAKAQGDWLDVVIARDQNVRVSKGSLPVLNELERYRLVAQSKLAHEVHLGNKQDRLQILKVLNPDIIALGFDQKAPIAQIKKILPGVKIVRLSSYFPEKYKSSILRKTI
jgi:FAD synthetase